MSDTSHHDQNIFRGKSLMAKSKKKTTGRPSLLTRDIINQIATALRSGMSWRGAAHAAGVSERAVHQWRKRGELEGGLFAELVVASARAVADSEGGATAQIMKSILHGKVETRTEKDGQGNVIRTIETVRPAEIRDIIMFLARRFPESWGPPAAREPAPEHSAGSAGRIVTYDPAERSDPVADQAYIDSHGPNSGEAGDDGYVIELPKKNEPLPKDAPLSPEEVERIMAEQDAKKGKQAELDLSDKQDLPSNVSPIRPPE